VFARAPSFRLLNMRAPGRFVLYRGGLAAPVAAAVRVLACLLE